MYETLGLSPGKTLLVQGIYGAVGPITNFLLVNFAQVSSTNYLFSSIF